MLLSRHWGTKQEMGFDMLAVVQREYIEAEIWQGEFFVAEFMFIIVWRQSCKTLGNVISNMGFIILGFYV